jgi:hypothetical protein
VADTPVSELIADNIVTTLGGITTTGGAYHHTASAVMRRKQFGQPTSNNLIIVNLGDKERNDEANPKNRRITWVQSYWIDFYIIEAEGGGDIDERINKAVSDVEKILMVDHTRGGYAHDTFPSGAVIFPDEEGGGVAGVSVLIRVQYRTLLTDPNTQS